MTLLFDIGATHMRLTIATEDGIGAVERTHTPQDPEEGARVFKEIASRFGSYEHAIGGIAGTVLSDGSIVGANNLPAWMGFPIRDALGSSVDLHNDAELNALGEWTYGAGKGTKSMAYLGLGTGVGTCLIVDGEVVPSSSGGALRERIVELSDDSDLEERIGGHALHEHFHRSPEELTHEEWEALTSYLVEGVKNVIEAWTPDMVVIGGSEMNEAAGFSIERVRELVGGATPIVEGKLTDVSGLWGARALV